MHLHMNFDLLSTTTNGNRTRPRGFRPLCCPLHHDVLRITRLYCVTIIIIILKSDTARSRLSQQESLSSGLPPSPRWGYFRTSANWSGWQNSNLQGHNDARFQAERASKLPFYTPRNKMAPVDGTAPPPRASKTPVLLLYETGINWWCRWESNPHTFA